MENADLLTAAAAALDRYRAEEAQLETEISVLQARLELTREFVTALSGKPRLRRGRPPRVAVFQSLQGESRSNMIEMPDQVGGGMAEAEPETAA